MTTQRPMNAADVAGLLSLAPIVLALRAVETGRS
jgi:hypothetical protein